MKNSWFDQFIENFAGAYNRNITEKQAAIFMKYSCDEEITRYATTYTGKTDKYKFICQGYKKGRYDCFALYVRKNNDAEINRLKAEFNNIEKILDTDISDQEFDRLEERQKQIQDKMYILDNEY